MPLAFTQEDFLVLNATGNFHGGKWAGVAWGRGGGTDLRTVLPTLMGKLYK